MAKECLIIGGTGTLGKALIPILAKKGFSISVLSRDELKQKELKAKFPLVKTILGDIRDYESIEPHCLGKDVVFHLAAMKHVDMAESNIEESIKVNLLGTVNVAKACFRGNVGFAVFSSTDKAVLPINVYGMCKGLSEKFWFDSNRWKGPKYSVFRWGNVLGSRGSVIHAFVESLKKTKTIKVTDFEMSRFWIHIDDAAKFMADNYEYAPEESPCFPPIKAASLLSLAEGTANVLGISNYDVEKIPVRPGEKIHEWLDYHDPGFEFKSNTSEQYSAEELHSLIKRTLAK